MSKIVSAHSIVPDLARQPSPIAYPHAGGGYIVERSLALMDSEFEVKLPQPRSMSALSRAGLLLNCAGLLCRKSVETYVAADPARVGIYSALENGPGDYGAPISLMDPATDGFAGVYRSSRSPKQHFRFLPNVPASYLSIFLGIEGPLHVLTHSRHAADQCLAQAEFDLAYGVVDAALVCSAFSLENPLVSIRTWMDAPPQGILCEGAACLVLVPDDCLTDWGKVARWNPGSAYFGIADSLLRLCGGPREAGVLMTTTSAEESQVYA